MEQKHFQRTSKVARSQLLPSPWRQSLSRLWQALLPLWTPTTNTQPLPKLKLCCSALSPDGITKMKSKTFHAATGHGGLNISLKLPQPLDLRLQWNTPKCLLWNPLHSPFGLCTMLRVPPRHKEQHLHRVVLWNQVHLPASMLPESRAAVALRWSFQHRSQNKFHSGKAACSQERVRFWTDSEFVSACL